MARVKLSIHHRLCPFFLGRRRWVVCRSCSQSACVLCPVEAHVPPALGKQPVPPRDVPTDVLTNQRPGLIPLFYRDRNHE